MNGRINTMKTTIDDAGRLVIPKEIRQQAGLKPGIRLEIHWKNGKVEIEPEPLPVRLERRGRLVVAVPARKVAPLSAQAVEAVRKRLRLERTARG